jgi:hypothetical protein
MNETKKVLNNFINQAHNTKLYSKPAKLDNLLKNVRIKQTAIKYTVRSFIFSNGQRDSRRDSKKVLVSGK